MSDDRDGVQRRRGIGVAGEVLAEIDALLDTEEDDPFPWCDAAVWYSTEAGGEPPPTYVSYYEMLCAVMQYGEVALPDMSV